MPLQRLLLRHGHLQFHPNPYPNEYPDFVTHSNLDLNLNPHLYSHSSATFTRTSTPTSTYTFTASFTSSPTKTPTHTPTAEATVIIYPNPAKWPGPVKLQISLPSYAGQVEIELFTIAFRKVNELVLFNLHEGINTINIPLTDREGTPLANGVYYVVVQTPNGRFISKLLVLN